MSLYITWSSLSVAQEPGTPNMLAIQGVHFLVSLLLGAVLILARKPISRWLTPQEADVSASSATLIAVGAALIGIGYLAAGLVTLGTHYARLETVGAASPDSLWRGGLSIASGIMLFASSVGIGRLWLRLRAL
ncbi:hypothetical protein ACFO0U_15940 [Chromohalobacter sarecensis]|uniref:DUF2231 domain-containing protein n=1 Tax=Chromohalobacter sarecensis TaxID=245294 RepID=A0ABV9D682_9GAMM|nr:hypothetical protein [Chromohalobacter sarecensis]MCK0713980.1 hypothetical protein [Chromohalobacter sarecensis]